MGALLSQLDKEEVEHPICYASRSCNPAEQNYSSFDGECLAVVWATNLFRPYLFGNSFTLVTDHEPLKWIMTTQKLTGMLARWSLLHSGAPGGNRQCERGLPYPNIYRPGPGARLGEGRNHDGCNVLCFKRAIYNRASEAGRQGDLEDVEVLNFL